MTFPYPINSRPHTMNHWRKYSDIASIVNDTKFRPHETDIGYLLQYGTVMAPYSINQSQLKQTCPFNAMKEYGFGSYPVTPQYYANNNTKMKKLENRLVYKSTDCTYHAGGSLICTPKNVN